MHPTSSSNSRDVGSRSSNAPTSIASSVMLESTAGQSKHGVEGRVVWRDTLKEYGKIEFDAGSVSFCSLHASNIWSHNTLQTNDIVLFSFHVDQHGKRRAFNVRPEATRHTPLRFEGRCTTFHPEHNCGFVSVFGTTHEISFHREDVMNAPQTPIGVDIPMKYEVDFSKQYPCAVNVTIINPSASNGNDGQPSDAADLTPRDGEQTNDGPVDEEPLDGTQAHDFFSYQEENQTSDEQKSDEILFSLIQIQNHSDGLQRQDESRNDAELQKEDQEEKQTSGKQLFEHPGSIIKIGRDELQRPDKSVDDAAEDGNMNMFYNCDDMLDDENWESE